MFLIQVSDGFWVDAEKVICVWVLGGKMFVDVGAIEPRAISNRFREKFVNQMNALNENKAMEALS